MNSDLHPGRLYGKMVMHKFRIFYSEIFRISTVMQSHSGKQFQSYYTAVSTNPHVFRLKKELTGNAISQASDIRLQYADRILFVPFK